MKKKLMTVFALVLVAVVSVAGTMAYLTDKDTVVNTFTVGNVDITLEEPSWNPDNEKDYKLKVFPGMTYAKDPTVTVEKGSEKCYVRLLVTVSDMTKLESAFPGTEYYKNGIFLLEKLVNWNKNAEWKCVGYENGTYEFRYAAVVDAGTAAVELEPLFTAVTIPADLDSEHIGYLKDISFTIVAEAIQAEGFTDANAAWAAFPATT